MDFTWDALVDTIPHELFFAAWRSNMKRETRTADRLRTVQSEGEPLSAIEGRSNIRVEHRSNDATVSSLLVNLRAFSDKDQQSV